MGVGTEGFGIRKKIQNRDVRMKYSLSELLRFYEQTKVKDLSIRSMAYGMKGVTSDGNDVIKVKKTDVLLLCTKHQREVDLEAKSVLLDQKIH